MAEISVLFKLFDDKSVREKIKVITKLEAALDDERNTDVPLDLAEQIDNMLQFEQTYKLTIEEL